MSYGLGGEAKNNYFERGGGGGATALLSCTEIIKGGALTIISTCITTNVHYHVVYSDSSLG